MNEKLEKSSSLGYNTSFGKVNFYWSTICIQKKEKLIKSKLRRKTTLKGINTFLREREVVGK